MRMVSSSASRVWISSGSPCVARRRDVVAEALRLRFRRRVLVVIVEARFADGDDFRMLGEAHDVGRLEVQLLVGVVRMRADRAVDIVEALGDGEHLIEAADARRDRHHGADACRASTRHHAVEIGGEVAEIQVAVVVDEHRFLCVPPVACGDERDCSDLPALLRLGWTERRPWPPLRDRRSAGRRPAARGRRSPDCRRPLRAQHIEAAGLRCKSQRLQQLGCGRRHHGLYKDGELANKLRRHIENGLHACRIGLLLRPRLLGGEISVRVRDDGPDGVEVFRHRLLVHGLTRFSIKGIGRVTASPCRPRSRAPGVGILPSQFLKIIDSERCARLPRLFARSALMRLTIASWL